MCAKDRGATRANLEQLAAPLPSVPLSNKVALGWMAFPCSNAIAHACTEPCNRPNTPHAALGALAVGRGPMRVNQAQLAAPLRSAFPYKASVLGWVVFICSCNAICARAEPRNRPNAHRVRWALSPRGASPYATTMRSSRPHCALYPGTKALRWVGWYSFAAKALFALALSPVTAQTRTAYAGRWLGAGCS